MSTNENIDQTQTTLGEYLARCRVERRKTILDNSRRLIAQRRHEAKIIKVGTLATFNRLIESGHNPWPSYAEFCVSPLTPEQQEARERRRAEKKLHSTPLAQCPRVRDADEDRAKQRETKGPEYGRPHLTGSFVEVDE